MNGKNCRVKGCWSRGMPRGISYYKSKNDNTKPPFYKLPRFRQSLINNVNAKQKKLLYKFHAHVPFASTPGGQQNIPHTEVLHLQPLSHLMSFVF